jgi:plasmid stability protein
MTRNITLAIDDTVLETVRIVAAEEKTTVNAMVRDYLTNVAKQRGRREEARAAFRELAERSEARLGPDYVWNREDIYADRVFPRHERADLRGDGKAR